MDKSLQYVCTGGAFYGLYTSLLISKLFCTKACKKGGGERVCNVILHTRYHGGGGWSEYVKLFYLLSINIQSLMSKHSNLVSEIADLQQHNL